MSVFQVKTTSKRAAKPKPRAMPPRPPSVQDQIGLIQGQTPGSKEEWWVYLALRRLNLTFYYQYPIKGGSSLRGGQKIDFLVFTHPLPTPLFVQGTYWHTGSRAADTQLKIAQARDYFKGQASNPVQIWTTDIPSSEAAYQSVKEKLAWA